MIHKDGNTYIDVKQLPHDTADAARLFGEMVKRAKEDMLGATIREANAGIRVVVIQLDAASNFENMDTTLRVLFSINDHKYDIKTTEERWERDVYKAIAEHIAIEVIEKLSRSKKL
jgi:hypothetical protein